jgi:methionyl-tRNA formyltransferase
MPSPVKAWALQHDLPVAHRLAALHDAAVDLVVVVAYGAMVSDALLATFPFLNVHFSLLPRWRGAAPVERAILAGDAETGVCVMGIVSALDAGPVYRRARTSVGRKTASELLAELAELGASSLLEVLGGGLPLPTPEPQVGEPTYAEKLSPSDFELRADDSAEVVLAKVRCERAFTTIDDNRFRILAAEACDDTGPAGSVEDGVFYASIGSWRPTVLQPDGGRAMTTEAWMSGRRGQSPARWGSTA